MSFQCTPVTVQDLDTPIYPGVRKGNGIDDDCDGKVDEELANGLGTYM